MGREADLEEIAISGTTLAYFLFRFIPPKTPDSTDLAIIFEMREKREIRYLTNLIIKIFFI